MAKIFLLLQDTSQDNFVKKICEYNKLESTFITGELEDILTQIHHEVPDIILIDNKYENCEFVIRQIKSASKNENIQVILLFDKEYETNFLNLADGIVEYPIREDILLSTINSHAKIKKSLVRLYENNKELSKSLYQLNVLYNTSSQFAGTLNTNKLYDIMIEAMEKTLSFDISSALIFNSTEKPIFNLNTMYPAGENLVNALKIRSVLNYKNTTENISLPEDKDFSLVETVQKTKQTRSSNVFGLEAISYDSLFAPIKVGDDFFGVIELFRKIPFTPEDVTCFQAITHQVALPLRSAKLYEEISVTNKKLEKLEKIKSEFVSIVSHELRTPVTSINNSLEIISSEQAGVVTEDTKHWLSIAKRNIEILKGIISDLLDLQRIQTGKLDFKYKTVDIKQSFELLQNTFTQIAQEKNIELDFEILENLPPVYADVRRVEQILTNLITNALKFTPDGGKVTVKTSLTDESEINNKNLVCPNGTFKGKYIKISVEDTGIGIKEEDIPKIFDKFSQIESSLNRNKGGVGLGLTITKQLIDAHLGAIWVDSEEQKGSSFNFVLPLPDDKKIFIMDLSKTLINGNSTGVIKIKAKKELGIIEILKENKLLNLSKLSKEITLENNENTVYYTYIPKISSGSFNAIFSNLSEYCSKIKQEKALKEYDIILEKSYCTDTACLNNIIKMLDND